MKNQKPPLPKRGDYRPAPDAKFVLAAEWDHEAEVLRICDAAGNLTRYRIKEGPVCPWEDRFFKLSYVDMPSMQVVEFELILLNAATEHFVCSCGHTTTPEKIYCNHIISMKALLKRVAAEDENEMQCDAIGCKVTSVTVTA